MKIYICTDMEGISGIPGGDFVLPAGTFFQEGRRYYTDDINACVNACFAAGATQVIVRDGHCAGNFALWDKIDPRAEFIQGLTNRDRYPELPGSDAAIMLGYHAMAGTRNAVLEHSFSSLTIQNLWLNDILVGEFGIDAAIAGDLGVPAIMATGDDKLCLEAAALVPGLVTCPVKTGYSCQGAKLLTREKAHALIHAKTLEAIAKLGQIKPFSPRRPVTLRREAVERQKATYTHSDDIKVLSERIVETTANSTEEAFWRIF